MKKSQFASLHAGMLVRAAAAPALRAKRKVEAAMAAEPAPSAAASQAAAQELPVWRSDGPMAFESWEHLRAELLPPGWGRSSAAGTDTAIAADVDDRPAATKPTLVARNDAAVDHDDGERQLRQRAGFGRRSTPPPSHDTDAGDAGTDAMAEAEAAMPTDVAEDDVAPTAYSGGAADVELDIPSPADFSATAFSDLDVMATALDYEDIRDEVLADTAVASIDAAAGYVDTDHDDVEFAEVEHVAPAAIDCDAGGDVIEAPEMATGRRKAMTVRLDLPRHRRLRLAGVYYGRSCQDLMVSSLDNYLAQLGFGADSES